MLTIPDHPPHLFSLGPIEPRTADRAFPLVHLYEPSLDRTAWRKYVREQAKGEGGVMSVMDPRGYVHGVFAWSIRRPLAAQREMTIRDLILLHLPGKGLQAAMMGAITAFARSRNCQTVVMGLEESKPSVRFDVLEDCGFHAIGERTYQVDLEPV